MQFVRDKAAQPHPETPQGDREHAALIKKFDDAMGIVRRALAGQRVNPADMQAVREAHLSMWQAFRRLALLRASQPPPEALKEPILLGPCDLHDHFGSVECPDCGVRRKLAEAESRAVAQTASPAVDERLRELVEKLRESATGNDDAAIEADKLEKSGDSHIGHTAGWERGVAFGKRIAAQWLEALLTAAPVQAEKVSLAALSAAPPAQPHPSQTGETIKRLKAWKAMGYMPSYNELSAAINILLAAVEPREPLAAQPHPETPQGEAALSAELAALRAERANIAEALGLPREAGDIASCDVVTHHAAGMHTALIAANATIAKLRLGPCHLHDHFGSGECPDCGVRRKLAEAESRAVAQTEALRALSQKLRQSHDADGDSYEEGYRDGRRSAADQLDALYASPAVELAKSS